MTDRISLFNEKRKDYNTLSAKDRARLIRDCAGAAKLAVRHTEKENLINLLNKSQPTYHICNRQNDQSFRSLKTSTKAYKALMFFNDVHSSMEYARYFGVTRAYSSTINGHKRTVETNLHQGLLRALVERGLLTHDNVDHSYKTSETGKIYCKICEGGPLTLSEEWDILLPYLGNRQVTIVKPEVKETKGFPEEALRKLFAEVVAKNSIMNIDEYLDGLTKDELKTLAAKILARL